MGDLRHLRGREESLCNHIGHGREWREEKWRWDGTRTPERGLGVERNSQAQRGPLTVRGSAGMERDLWGIRDWRGTQPVSPWLARALASLLGSRA